MADPQERPSRQSHSLRNISPSSSRLQQIIIPKRRSSLKNARSGNSYSEDNDQPEAYLSKSSSTANVSNSSVEELTQQYSDLQIAKQKPRAIDLSSAKNGLFTPPPDGSGANTPNVPASKAIVPFFVRRRGLDLTTPTRRRRHSYGAVVYTPPSSYNRFIPNRALLNTSTNHYRANKPAHELTPEQRQMRYDGVPSDPFTARRTTPQSNARTNSSSGRSPQARSVSTGGIWGVGGACPHHGAAIGIDNGRGIAFGSGTNARIYSSNFYDPETPRESSDRFEGRLAMALELDQSGKVLDFSINTGPKKSTNTNKNGTHWHEGHWVTHKLPSVLNAPSLRDDYYCTLLAHDSASHVMAVGLKNRVYLWSEKKGVVPVGRAEPMITDVHVTSLAFSSPGGGKSILATGRSNGQLDLWQVDEDKARIGHFLPRPIACLTFKPVPTRKWSERLNHQISVEELLVGDELGIVYYFCIEWPQGKGRNLAAMTLLAKIYLHKQQVCGLAWSPDGESFASGGNDNACYLVKIKDIMRAPPRGRSIASITTQSQPMSPHAPIFMPRNLDAPPPQKPRYYPDLRSAHKPDNIFRVPSPDTDVIEIGVERARHCWRHTAAVKAIAFCPWQQGLIATGGGSNDRAIRFFHTGSGACLATINVHAQVTSLIWSKTRREICATFGYAQPEHPYKIAVFSWPDCHQVVRIPWSPSMRALHAIAYPGGPNDESKTVTGLGKGKARARTSEGGRWWSRTKEEGCVVVAGSDESVKFHEVWSGNSICIGTRSGGLAWSRILESEEGGDVDFGGDIIR